MKRQLFGWSVIVALALAGCGDDDGKSQDNGEKGSGGEDVSQNAKAWDPALGTVTVKGTVKFKGTPPRRRPVDTGAEPKCEHLGEVLDESVIVNDDGTLKNVFVWVKKGLGDWRFPVPTEAALLSQKGCTYRPHVQALQARQELVIRNDDDFLHNVHVFAKRNKDFNLGQAQKGMETTKTFSRPEVMIKVKCDVHGWMSSYIGVVSHPYFAVTGDDGSFEFANLPPGEYTVEAWHEVFDAQTLVVKVDDKESKDIEFTFEEE